MECISVLKNNEALVTVWCMAYNHEKYIRKALDGFVKQKVNFRYEVIVHDDASTDGTADIIREYAKQYDWIRPIYQKENQHSKRIGIVRSFLLPNMRGKYVAFCEGDDYWTDENKLQKLVDYMEANDDCVMTCHAYNLVVANTEKNIGVVRTLESEGDITPEIAIRYKNPTQIASQIFIADVVRSRYEKYSRYGVGDYPMLLHAAACGRIHYFPDIMASHRVAADGSWTKRIYMVPEKRAIHLNKMKLFLEEYNKQTQFRFDDAVKDRIDDLDFSLALINKDYKAAKNTRYYRKEASFKRKAVINLGIAFPKLADDLNKFFEK